MQEGEGTVVGGLNAASMKRKTVACIIVQKDRQTQVRVQQANEAIDREVEIRGKVSPGLMQSLKGLLSMKFVRVNNKNVGGGPFQERLRQPRRQATSGWRVLRRHMMLNRQ